MRSSRSWSTNIALRAAGLDRINASLDTLRSEMFRKLARRDRLPDVLDGLAAAAEAGLAPVKVNAVLMRDLNDDKAAPLLRYYLDRGYELRFIEQMPLDAQHGWKRAEMVTADEILAALECEFTLTPDEAFLVDGGPARVGVIASVTRPFCGNCDRVRLTADGQVRYCLFARTESDLRSSAGWRDRRRAGRALAAGGQAKLKVTLSDGATGVLTITCVLGAPPAGKMEGITLVLGTGVSGEYTKTSCH